MRTIFAGLLLAVIGGAAAGAATLALPVAETRATCGWYVIYMCARSPGEAERWSDQHEAIPGFVLRTGPATPNFAPGWFCVVDGPLERAAAVARAAEIRSWGAAPAAYAKASCR